MMKSPTTKHFPFGVFLSLMSLSVSQTASAKSGAVDYSWGADGLAEATSFVGTMMIYTVADIYQDEQPRGRHHQEHYDACRWHPVHDRSDDCHASLLWLSEHEFHFLEYCIREPQ